jgi:hypothetical protein
VVKSGNLDQDISAGHAGIALTTELTPGWRGGFSPSKESPLQKYKYCLWISEKGCGCLCLDCMTGHKHQKNFLYELYLNFLYELYQGTTHTRTGCEESVCHLKCKKRLCIEQSIIGNMTFDIPLNVECDILILKGKRKSLSTYPTVKKKT